MNRLVVQQVTAPSTTGAKAHEVLAQRSWRYDAAGRAKSIADKRGAKTSYEYDSLGQLAEASTARFHRDARGLDRDAR
jgi:YD repeat-containing protein